MDGSNTREMKIFDALKLIQSLPSKVKNMKGGLGRALYFEMFPIDKFCNPNSLLDENRFVNNQLTLQTSEFVINLCNTLDMQTVRIKKCEQLINKYPFCFTSVYIIFLLFCILIISYVKCQYHNHMHACWTMLWSTLITNN